MNELTERTAVVTGAGSGIGRGAALGLAAAGAAVGVIDLNADAARDTAATIVARGGRSAWACADVADETQVAAAVAHIERSLGGVDVLVNNAAVDNATPLMEMTPDIWDEMIRVNLRSVYVCSRAVLSGMQSRRWGRIINVASQTAYKGARDMTHYAAAKAGVLGFTRSLAYEVVSDGITVNAVAPGAIATPMQATLPPEWVAAKIAETPIGRSGTVDEVVPSIVLLASDAGAFFVGACVSMNGGDHMA